MAGMAAAEPIRVWGRVNFHSTTGKGSFCSAPAGDDCLAFFATEESADAVVVTPMEAELLDDTDVVVASVKLPPVAEVTDASELLVLSDVSLMAVRIVSIVFSGCCEIISCRHGPRLRRSFALNDVAAVASGWCKLRRAIHILVRA